MIVKNENQIQHIWKRTRLKQHFLKIISNTQLRGCPLNRSILITKLNDLVYNEHANDKEIYDEMFYLVQNFVIHSAEWNKKGNEEYRGAHRTEKLLEIIRKCKPRIGINRVLDIGCADGKITSFIGKTLGLNKDQVFGCDVLENDDANDSYTYSQIKNNDLPYASRSMDLVVAFMSFHHIKHISKTLKEIDRILKPNGLLIIREHNCLNNDISTILDVVHGFYTMVWSNPKEFADFGDYYIHYRSSKEWKRLITRRNAFREIYNDSKDENYWKLDKFKDRIPNPLRYYYAVYEKQPDTRRKRF